MRSARPSRVATALVSYVATIPASATTTRRPQSVIAPSAAGQPHVTTWQRSHAFSDRSPRLHQTDSRSGSVRQLLFAAALHSRASDVSATGAIHKDVQLPLQLSRQGLTPFSVSCPGYWWPVRSWAEGEEHVSREHHLEEASRLITDGSDGEDQIRPFDVRCSHREDDL